MNNKFLYAGLVLLLLYAFRLWTKINAVRRFQYRSLLPRNIRFERGALKFDLEMVVVNPTTNRVVIDGLDLDVFVGKTLIGKAVIFQTTPIEPYTENTLRTSVICPLDVLLTAVPDINVQAKTVAFAFDGVIRAYGLTAPVLLNYNIAIPKIFK
jgi:hypothetical protein